MLLTTATNCRPRCFSRTVANTDLGFITHLHFVKSASKLYFDTAQ